MQFHFSFPFVFIWKAEVNPKPSLNPSVLGGKEKNAFSATNALT